tara:strand:+ start:1981 stop:3189 length:1209 start_codon:yes stop_codon:yes gene_type:complete
MDALQKACYIDGNQEACRMIRGRTPMKNRGMEMAQGGLLEDASRNWRMESTYPESAKGEARSLEKGAVPTKPPEEKFMYSPLQRGYAEGGEVDMDTTGSMLTPEVPLNFEDDMMSEDMMSEDMMMEDETGLNPEQEQTLAEAMSDYPELEEILDILGSTMETSEFTGAGQVDGPGTETSDSIPAQLSDGEFVFTAKAVKQLGVDKLRKMMSKAEMDYNEGEEKQEYAQMGDMGFAAGGYSLMKKPKKDSYSQGGKVRDRKLSYGGSRFTKAQIAEMSKTFGEGFMKLVKSDGKGMFRVQGMAEGGAVANHMNRNQATETFGQKAKGLGQKALDVMERVLGPVVDKGIDAFFEPVNSIDPNRDYEGIERERKEREFTERNRAEADEQRARDMAKPSALLDRKG